MQPFGERFRETIGKRLQHDRAVVVVGALELDELLLDAQAGSDGERPHIVGYARIFGGDEIGQAIIWFAERTLVLLAQVVPRHRDGVTGRVGVDLDVIAGGIRRRDHHHAVGGEPSALDQALEHLLTFRVHVARRLADDGIGENGGIRPGQLPSLEERRPIDQAGELAQIGVLELAPAYEVGCGRGVMPPIGLECIGARRCKTNQRRTFFCGVLHANLVVIESDCGDGVAKLVEARGGGNVLEFAVPFVVIKKRRAETDDK